MSNLKKNTINHIHESGEKINRAVHRPSY